MTVYTPGMLYDLTSAFVPSGSQPTAIAIIQAESGGNSAARNVNTDGSIDRGLWQINNKAHPEVSDACAFNPECSTLAALRISNQGKNFTPWTTFVSGAYQKFLQAGGSTVPAPNADSGFLGTGIGSPSGLPNPLSSISDISSALSAFFNFLTDIQTWIRIGKALGGAVLLIMGLRTLTGSNGLPTVPTPIVIRESKKAEKKTEPKKSEEKTATEEKAQ